MWFQKISILPPQKGLEIPGRRGVSKSQKFEAMYEAKLEIPGGVGGHRANPFHGGGGGGVWIFSETTQYNVSNSPSCSSFQTTKNLVIHQADDNFHFSPYLFS